MSLVTERWSTPKITKGANGWQHTRVFDVTGVDNLNDAISAVEDHDASTAHNAESPLSEYIYVDSRSGESTGFNFWTVTVSYSSSPEGRHPDPENMLNEPTKWRVVPSCEQTSSSVDAYGVEVLNTSGQAFSTDPPAFERFITLIGERVEPYFNLQQAVQFTNAVNNSAITLDGTWSLEKGQICCRSVLPLTPITGSEDYVIVQYVFEIRQGGDSADSDGYYSGFKIRILNEGTEGFYDSADNVRSPGPLCRLRVDPSTGKDVPEKVSYPVRLDQQGRPMGAGIFVMCPKDVDPDGYTEPVGNDDIYAGVIEATDHAYFIKIFPKGIQFRNFADLGL